jgi:hypothetical protein
MKEVKHDPKLSTQEKGETNLEWAPNSTRTHKIE